MKIIDITSLVIRLCSFARQNLIFESEAHRLLEEFGTLILHLADAGGFRESFQIVVIERETFAARTVRILIIFNGIGIQYQEMTAIGSILQTVYTLFQEFFTPGIGKVTIFQEIKKREPIGIGIIDMTGNGIANQMQAH